MTRPSKKDHERRLASRFLEHIECTSLEDSERPDFRVRRVDGDFALEVTEYHSQALEGETGKPRVAVEAIWWRHLWPAIERNRRQKPNLKNVRVQLHFSDRNMPSRSACETIAGDLVECVNSVVGDQRFLGHETTVTFISRSSIVSAHASMRSQEGPLFFGENVLLPEEDWANIAKCFDSLIVRSIHFLEWVEWTCMNATISWVGPDVSEFRRALEKKAAAAKEYVLDGLPLWLLIVCDSADDGDEAPGDLSSHMPLSSDDDLARIKDVVHQTGFDFQTGPFSEVWLFSAFNGARFRLYPA